LSRADDNAELRDPREQIRFDHPAVGRHRR
jgi:hypothetical protein